MTTVPSIDRGYATLLTHLSRSSAKVNGVALQSAIAYYLAHAKPTPTTLAASIVASSLFRSFEYAQLEALVTAFRQAALLKHRLLKEEVTGLLSASVESKLNSWIEHVRSGLKDGHAVLRLVCSGGLLLAADDITQKDGGSHLAARNKVENDTILALAETMSLLAKDSSTTEAWESEFVAAEKEALHTILIVSSAFLELLPSRKLKALPLDVLTSILDDVIISTFTTPTGSFLYSAKEFATVVDGQLSIAVSSSFARHLTSSTNSRAFTSIAYMAKLHSHLLTVLASSRPIVARNTLERTLCRLENLAKQVEMDWEASPLPDYRSENQIAPETRELTKHTWSILKTLLFTSIMLIQAALTCLVYMSPQTSPPTSPDLALLALDTFAHLAFVISQFGGIASASGTGFFELKRAAYTALDVLATSSSASERFVRGICTSFEQNAKGKAMERPERDELLHAKLAFALACVEQLIPVLSAECVEGQVIPLCIRYVDDPSHRETYESAHSVLLAIFFAAAQQNPANPLPSPLAPVAARLVPFYANCLMRNSIEDHLADTQLRHAFAALVRCASTPSSNGEDDHGARAWFCIEALLKALSSAEGASAHHRLRLALVSCISALPLSVLPRALDTVREAFVGVHNAGQRFELAKALFEEMLHNVGDVEKAYVMEWWHTHQEELGASGDENTE